MNTSPHRIVPTQISALSTLPLKPATPPALPLWREADDRWHLDAFGTGGTTAGILWGLGFLAGGGWMTLGALGLIPFDTTRVRVPLPVFALIGTTFAVVGLFLGGRALWEWKKSRAAAERKNQIPGSRALADYPWDVTQSPASPWRSAIRRTFLAGFLALFLAPFVWLFFFHVPAPLLMRALIALFMLAVLWMAFLAVRAWLRAFKFGASAVRYARFPLHPGGDVVLHWRVPAGCRDVLAGHFTLRAIEERLIQSSSSHRRRRVSRTRKQLWSARWELAAPVTLRAHEEHALTFSLPAEAPGTWLGGGETARYWELGVELSLPGVDFRENYLVPVYREPTAA